MGCTLCPLFLAPCINYFAFSTTSLFNCWKYDVRWFDCWDISRRSDDDVYLAAEIVMSTCLWWGCIPYLPGVVVMFTCQVWWRCIPDRCNCLMTGVIVMFICQVWWRCIPDRCNCLMTGVIVMFTCQVWWRCIPDRCNCLMTGVIVMFICQVWWRCIPDRCNCHVYLPGVMRMYT